MLATLLLGTYASVSTIAVLLLYRQARCEPLQQFDVLSLLKECSSVQEKAAVLSATADVAEKRHPWYERALSVTGVIAFFAMTLATAVQTMRASLDEASAQRLEFEIEKNRERIAESDRVVAALSRILLERSAGAAQLPADEESVLRFRLRRLAEKSQPSIDEVREMIGLSFGLKDYGNVVDLIESRPGLLDEASPPDRVTLCEYYYLVGSQDRATDLLKDLWPKRRNLPMPVLQRLIVMSALLEPDATGLVEELADARRISSTSAKIVLDQQVAAFAAGSKRLMLPRSPDTR